ncbi:unnamed protein product [Blepharisma stoltei]|uniref:RING-type domain-containing protein n=1 Tax=Blepharisma stoltei TaxID=1481888 RepID=A0AAU9KLH5_9CILI|nr:unnamed protein product [Blepharisma stoltei]
MSSTKQHLIIPSKIKYKYLYLGIYSASSKSFSYSLYATASSEIPCYNGCSGNGLCSSGLCNCTEGFIGRDCSVRSTKLALEIQATLSLSSCCWKYADLSLLDYSKDLQINITSSTYIDIYMKPYDLYEYNSVLPSKLESEAHKYGYNTFSFKISLKNIGPWYFAFYNPSHSTSTFTLTTRTVDSSSSSSSNIIYIIASVSAAVFLITLIFAIYKIKTHNKASTVSEDSIRPEFIDKNFPKIAFKKRKHKANCKDCAICLDKFKDSDMIRELACSHIYHARCIDLWFERNTFCCLCKREIMSENIENRLGLSETFGNMSEIVMEELESPTVTTENQEQVILQRF